MTLSSIRTAVRTVRSRRAWSTRGTPSPSGRMWLARLTDPRLQTATSSAEVFSVISVHRFEECTTPTCCCGERRLQGSLKVIHGCPVSKSIVSIRRHRSTARMRRYTWISPLSAAAS